MYFATVPVVSYIYMFMKIYINVFAVLENILSNVIMVFAILSMIFGVFGGLLQRRIKKFVAYSSVSTIGYILIGIYCNNIVATQQCLLYLFIYSINLIGIFIIIIHYRKQYSLDHIRQLSGLYIQNKYIAISFSVYLFSLAGIPPLAGFIGKLYLFTSYAIDGMYFLIVISVIFTLIGCYYYIRIIKMIFYDRMHFSIQVCTYEYYVAWSLLFIVLFNVTLIFLLPLFDNIFMLISICLHE